MVQIDYLRDALLTPFGIETLKDRYLLPEEKSPQDAFARAASAFADNEAHAQRLYDYASKLWFMFSTPILSNGGTTRGLPISCFLSQVGDERLAITEHWTENMFLASSGGGIGCVDKETEFLTENGWKTIDSYKDGDTVCVVDPKTREASFEFPEKYLEGPSGNLYKLSNSHNSIVVSNNHRNYVSTGSNNYNFVKTDELIQRGISKFRFSSKFKTNQKGISFTDDEIRFMVALAADGTERRTQDYIKFAFRRFRKIERMREILERLDIDYKCVVDKEGTYEFHIHNYGLKKLPLNFTNFGQASNSQLKVIADELGYWDGSFDLRTHNVSFSTTKQDEADFVQYVLSVVYDGKSSLGFKRKGEIVARRTSSISTVFNNIEEFETVDGKQYCFTTSTGMWLARRGGFIFLTGNSDWSLLRSNGTSTSKGSKSNGIIPFLKTVDAEIGAVSQGGTRRGSYVAYLNISHPEIEEHINIRKANGGDINRKCLGVGFHNAVNIPDSFMEAAKDNRDWNLVDPHTGKITKTVKARKLWEQLLETRVATGEPYFHFIDESNRNLPEYLKELDLYINGSNLCCEIYLPTSPERTAVCCLSSVNLETYDDWKDDPLFIEDIIRMLDNVLDVFIKDAPKELWRAVASAKGERSLGLGAMGFHSYLQGKNIPFEGPLAAGINMKMFSHMEEKAKWATRTLYKERGPGNDMGDSCARRNSHLIAIAPNASSSIVCGNASPSIEPYRANAFTQKTLSGSSLLKNKYLGEKLEEYGKNDEETWRSIMVNHGSVQHLDFLNDWDKDVFKTAIEIDQHWIIQHAADRQPYICQGQSVNLFFPANSHKKYIHDVHLAAWEKKLKGLYYLRSESAQRSEVVSKQIERIRRPEAEECFSCQG